MIWTLYLEAKEERRLFSRILQVLDSQRVTLHSFQGDAVAGKVCVRCVVSSEQDKAYRIEALLHRLHEIVLVSVQSEAGRPG